VSAVTVSEAFDRHRERLQLVTGPMRIAVGIRSIVMEIDRVVEEMDVADWHLDHRGLMAPGALGLLVDAVLSRSVMVAADENLRMATSHLHLELLRPIPRGSSIVSCAGQMRSIQDRFGLSEGEVVTSDGVVVARATLGAILFTAARPLPSSAAAPAAPPDPPPQAGRSHRLIADSPVHDALGTRVISARATGVRLTNPALPRFANIVGGVYGGVGVLMGERAMDVALRAALHESVVMRPVELRAAYVRPIPADGASIECRARVMYLGRRLAVVRGEVRAPDGRVAVLVDGSYVPESRSDAEQ
jgi:uncharacterized protein (TIGR00369 family)